MLDSTISQQITPSDILDILVLGCDERVHINPETGRNKYHLNPVERDGLLQRGSCTANVLTPSGEEVAREFLGKYENLSYESLLESQSHRLRELVQSEFRDPFDVFFAPSGSDLVYYPIMFQRLLNPTRRLVNIVSCPQELGSGSLYASEGKFYGQCNQFGESTSKGDLVDPTRDVDVHYLGARADDGVILDRTQAFKNLVEENSDAAVVGSLVLGSKSGIKDDLEIIDPSSDTMWVVDLCQFRVDHTLIHKLLERGVLVMLTGSKFFQSPPFCAAMLVPRGWCERLRSVEDVSSVAPFAELFSAYDLPWYMTNLRSQLPRRENKGLRLRWEIALDEMESYSAWSFDETEEVINTWGAGVMKRLSESQYFELMPDQLKTNPSIISFQVWVNERALDHAQLKALFEAVCVDKHEGFSEEIKRVFFGQPVAYGGKSFIRIALGSNSIRKFLEVGDLDLNNDYRLIEILENYAERIFGS
jgi:hypothetical protein